MTAILTFITISIMLLVFSVCALCCESWLVRSMLIASILIICIDAYENLVWVNLFGGY